MMTKDGFWQDGVLWNMLVIWPLAPYKYYQIGVFSMNGAAGGVDGISSIQALSRVFLCTAELEGQRLQLVFSAAGVWEVK